MPRIYINKQLTQTEAQTVAQLAESLGLPERGIAVAVGNRIVPKAEWNTAVLEENVHVTIIKAVFGG